MAGRAARASTTIPSIRPRCLPLASDARHSKPSPPRTRMLGYDWPRFHAAVNDLPAALLFVTVLFDLGAWVTKRESLKAAALWTLWAGVIGGKMVFEHAAGVPAATMRAEMENRKAGHVHDADEDADEHAHARADSTHGHAPATPPHAP